ncbi:histidinol dehydrogenase [Enemella evansiae]|uniref:histidinol dehydrogenase n=1 Tax=Enemella evansiae TaxID=2016499 RepID=UPI000B960854|nr:histidinol dehydrogenase [Enemella evansiae]OYO19580.1 histidinol dehydrogenase [Enemella evansiae]TDO91376.1 sulfopropanediol 3-dehydrogenase [Enemella evansiae]
MSKVLKSGRSKSFIDTNQADVQQRVTELIAEIRGRGEAAVRECSAQFDNWEPESFRLSEEQIQQIIGTLDQQVIDDIAFVQEQIRGFAQAQRDSMTDIEVETLPGVFLGHTHVPVASAGAYIPGGKYPLTASAHMTIITAKVAGVPRVVACTPPIRGEIPAATIAAMKMAGADEIYVLGGVQAVASMAIGTEFMEPVNVIAGPGNAYVAEAKRQLFGEVGIDLFAGPTEILILADETADPFLIAVDLLSQAEHGPDSPAVLVTTDEGQAARVLELIEEILPGLQTRDIAEVAWRDYGQVIVADSMDELWQLGDEFASEHVQVFTSEPRDALTRMQDYGALFLGENTCVSYGDKVIGTNHVLPTLGAARYTGGLWVGKYLKTCTYQEIRDPAASGELGLVCGRAARVELFEGHARSGDARANRHLGRDFAWIDEVGSLQAVR